MTRSQRDYYLDGHTPSALVQLDFRHAFDRVDHKIRGTVSDTVGVLSGVPQGNVLGPTLFNVFINDVVPLQCGPLLYADDLTLIHPISDAIHQQQLQRDLEAVYGWSCQNRLPLNADKCLAMMFSCARRPLVPP